MKSRSSLVRALALSTLLLIGTACSGSDSAGVSTPPAPPLDQLVVAISPKYDSLLLGTSRTYTARVTNQAGVPRSVPVTWSSLSPAIATVSNGTVTAIAGGEARLVASVGASADTATLIVTLPQIELRLSPGAVAATLGDTLGFVASIAGPGGASTVANDIRWAVSDSTSARFVGEGELTTLAEGDLTVYATVSGTTAMASVRVTASPVASITITPSNLSLVAGGSATLKAELRDSKGRLITGRVANWSSSNTAVAKVDTDGVVTAVAAGGAVITASSTGKTATAAVNVSAPGASSVVITLPNDSLGTGRTMQATATPLDANGNALTGRPVAWQSSNPSVATINSSGVITGLIAGQTTISVICDGKTASQKVTIAVPVATTVTLLPASALLLVGATTKLSVEVRDQFSVVLSGKAITWSSSTPSIATVSSTGSVTGVSLGTTTVRAAVGTISDSSTVTVQSVPVATVSLSPTSTSVEEGDAVALSATARDSSGNVLSNRPVSWASSATAVAAVSATGVVSGVTVGSATITAIIEGKSAQTTVTVTAPPAPPVGQVTVSLNSSVLNVGESTRAIAKVYDTNGNEMLDRTVTFATGNPNTATVTLDGRVKAQSTGSTTVSASVDGQSGLASVTVQPSAPAPVDTVVLSIPTTTLTVGDSTQLSVQLRDSTGAVLTGRTISFTSSSTSIATVSVTGQLRAVGAGSATIVAASEGKSASVALVVNTPTSTSPAPVATVTVTLNASTLNVGQTTQAVANLRDSSGTLLSGRTIAWSSSNTAAATVAQSGVVTAVGAGSATISAQSEGKSGGAALTAKVPVPAVVTSVQVTLNPSNITVGSTSQATAVAKDSSGAVITGRTVTWAASGGGTVATVSSSTSSSNTVTGTGVGTSTVSAMIDGVSASASLGVAAAPSSTITLPTPPTLLNFSYPTVSGKSWVVRAGDNLQTVLNQAQRGDEIVLEAGASFSGNFTLPNKTGTSANGWVLIRSDKSAQLPPQGTRVTSANASLMPKLVTPNTGAALATVAGTSGWWISGVEFTVAPAVTAVIGRVVAFGASGSTQNSLSQVPNDLVLDRVYIHPQTTQNVQRCLELNSARSAVQDSYLVECHAKGFDSQAIVSWNGPGPFKIVNNTLAGAGENIMFGGADPTIAGLVPSDAEIRRNYIYTPVSWKGVWTKKNLFETKNARRLLIEGNVFEGSWTDGQVGYAFVLKVANQSGACTWCTTSDLIIRNNIIRNVGAAFGITGREGGNPNPVGALLNKLLIENNVVENVNTGAYTGDGRLVSIMQNASDITIRSNTMTAPGALSQYINIGNVPAATNFAFQNNIASYGSYGFFSSQYGIGETVNVPAFRGQIIFEKSVLIGAVKTGYPNAQFVSSLSAALATGLGANAPAVNSATQGVVIP